ncbi:DUF397 domain-containing protein [Streptomyces griseocarneus]|uniref:DUF397 domain-containing protein n=1 Tax=Streptomyces griseocarneus TaxID=51201 RepID=UPI00167EE45E|nr:DUF397 domain-containing protein [Streptomyces griseocarneus]MBZ6477355.1 DUF397 domain-containing protein [Streptomyces griseocarneus]GHG76009.1 hypothetical protein GCM10018779_53930 [Streptomyces griseocarneus]
MPDTDWQRSSFCGGGGNNCLEIRPVAGMLQVRESQMPASVITVTPMQLAVFVTGVKTGTLG